MQITATQQRVLDVLRKIKEEGAALIPEADARALGGLCEIEKRRYIGVIADGHHIGNVYCRTWAVADCNIRTFHALARRGLVTCEHGVWAAT